MAMFFILFFISGFCSILYELIWLRLAMAQFGVTSALASIVISSFMAGLGFGSWFGGRYLRHNKRRSISALRLYALAELLIGVSAILVPHELRWGRLLLEHTGWASSGSYYFGSGLWIALTLAPWSACMGATIPFAVEAMKSFRARTFDRSFSYLYLANVLGALAGAVVPPLLVELRGFSGTLMIAAGLNCLLAISAFMVSLRITNQSAEGTPGVIAHHGSPSSANRWQLVLLFGTGVTSMGMEVVWIRQFTPYAGTMVYSFACILAIYLGSTFVGSKFYRGWARKQRQELPSKPLIWGSLGLLGLLSLISADPTIPFPTAMRILIGLAPFSALLGFLTPMLVDLWAGNDPDRAGRAYAVNVMGCIAGPLLAGFVLLPAVGERSSLLLLCLPWLASGFTFRAQSSRRRIVAMAVLPLALVLFFTTRGFEDTFPKHEILRDATATVIASGEGMDKRLLVNGVGITLLTPITKIMAHLPLAFLTHPPKNALVICFGMGTTYRSLLSWGIPTTAVELVPSVPRLFWYYHADGPQLLASPLSHVVIDDGRRFLERTAEQYDVIAIDPPPPVEAAASSLLYSEEFYAIVRARLRPGGILQQWLPGGDPTVHAAVTRALTESFPYVRAFHSIGGWGIHYLASSRPLPNWTAEELVRHMPPSAVKDLMEWGPQTMPELQIGAVLGNEISTARLIAENQFAPALRDDRPVNEYFLLRRSSFFRGHQ